MDQTVSKPATAQAAAPLSEAEKNTIIAGVLLSMLLAALDQTIVAPAMPTIAAALGHAQYLPWIVTAYLLTATAMAPLYGKISDVHGRRPTLYAAILIFLAGSLVAALAPNMLMLILGRAIQGVGGGGLFALAQIVIGDLVPPKERARYAAWISGTWAVASIAGPLLGGTFAEHLHWSLIFWVNLPLGLLAMAIINKPLKKLPIAAHRHSIDWAGAALLVTATSLLLLALNWGGGTYAWGSPEILGLAAASTLFWAVFALRLAKAAEPLISLNVLRNAIVLAGALSLFMLQAASIGLSVYLPVYLQTYLGLTASASGIAMLGLLLGTVAGAATSAVCVALLAYVAGNASLASVIILTTCVGIGTGTTFPVATISVQNAVEHVYLGVATGVLTFMRSLGGALGVALLGAVAAGYGLPLIGEGSATKVQIASATPFAAVFAVSFGLLVATLVALSLMPEKPLRGRVETDTPVLAE